jgi:hypothetical protein
MGRSIDESDVNRLLRILIVTALCVRIELGDLIELLSKEI